VNDFGRVPVAVLGATGVVGQRLVASLETHPWFELVAVAASERSAGRPYGESVRWLLPGEVPSRAAALTLSPCEPERVRGTLVFSALDAGPAREVEPRFRAAGRTVVSNASAHRLDPEVPLVIPEVNASHLELARRQRPRHGGCLVTNPNCSTIGLCLALEPLRRATSLEAVRVTTLQALSGAGYPGVASLDVVDNVLPLIAGEEEKIETEPLKIFGILGPTGVDGAPVAVSAQCNRVAVREGHTLCVSISGRDLPDAAGAEALLRGFRSPLAGRGLPSAPERPVLLREESDRPQPLRDRDASAGMAVSVGRVRRTPAGDLRFVAVAHNAVRGAAGGTLLLAELMAAEGLV